MGSKGSTRVEAVDPWEVGRADATFNRIDAYTPFGSLTYGGPNRNVANLQLNPYLAGTENRRMLSDRMLMDMALGRQQSMQQGGLPALTGGINPGAMREYFGLPTTLQSGADQYPMNMSVPDVTGQAAGIQPNQKGGQQGGGMKGSTRAASQGLQQAATPGGGVYGQGGKGGAPQMMEAAGKPSQGIGDIGQPPQQGGPIFGGTVGGLFDPSTFGQIGSLDQLQDFDLDRGRVEQSMFDRSASLLNPQFDQAEQRMVSDLRARGIPRDSEAFEREMSNFRRDKGETFQRLADQSVLAGGGEQSRLFGLSSALGDRAMGAQSQLFNMADQLSQRDIQAQLQNANIASMNRATQFNELASLLGLQQVASPGLNNFFAPGNVDMTGAYALNQQARQGNADRSAQMKGGALGGLMDIGGAAMGGGMVPKVGGGK